MSTFKARGVVIKEAAKGEADKVLTLFCKEIGKITVFAKGAGKSKSKFLAGSQLFTYSDFVIYDGNAFLSVTQIDIIKHFYNIRTDYDRLCCASYIVGLLDRILYSSTQSDNLLLLLLKSLSALVSEKIHPALVRVIFEIKLLDYEGYTPEADACAGCGKTDFSPLFFGVEGLLCGACAEGVRATEISEPALYAIRHILLAKPDGLFTFNVSDNVLDVLKRSCYIIMKSHFEGVV